MNSRKVFLTLWLSAPLVAVAALCVWIVVSMHAGPKMDADPVGAGAGHTGGANALGEWLSHRQGQGKVRIVLEDRTGKPGPQNPLLLASRANDWQGVPLSHVGDNRWEWQGPATDLDRGFEILWKNPAGQVLRGSGGRLRLLISSGEQAVLLDKLIP